MSDEPKKLGDAWGSESNPTHQFLLSGGYDSDRTNDKKKVTEITIFRNGTQSLVEWNPMISSRLGHSSCLLNGNIISISSNHELDSIGTIESYNVFSRTTVMNKHKLPLYGLQSVATTVHNGRVYCIGGFYIDLSAVPLKYAESDKVFFLDESGSWKEHPTTLLNARFGAAITTFQN